jgi:hypothetical protein
MNNLKLWTRPDNYFGAEWPEHYVAYGRHRDSDVVVESNFHSLLRRLGGESDTVKVIRESHWAVGWVEWIGIHKSDASGLRIASECLSKLSDYPILDEDDHSRREAEECDLTWRECYRPKERARYLRDRGVTVGFRELRLAVNGDWAAAANLLPCPSEIIH